MKKNNRGGFIAVLLIILVIAAIAAWFYFSQKERSGQAGTTPEQHTEHTSAPDGRVHADNTPQSAPDANPARDNAGDMVWDTDITIDLAGLELPYYDCEDFIIRNEAGRYTVLYDTLYRQAAWVAYLLTREDVSVKEAERKNKFVADPEVLRRGYPMARTSHYTGSGYDRGHLCPSADRTRTQKENDGTFHMSNISPQTPSLNRRLWKNLEEATRRWADRYDSLYIVTGGVLKPGLKTISEGIGVPEDFYKVILTRHEGEYHAVAFIIPNTESHQGTFMDHAVCVDSAEAVTGFDFFHRLPAGVQHRAEADFSAGFWTN